MKPGHREQRPGPGWRDFAGRSQPATLLPAWICDDCGIARARLE
jgi:hypothetical protein